MKKKNLTIFLCFAASISMLAGCNSNSEEVKLTQNVEAEMKVPGNTEVPISNQVSEIVGFSEESAQSQIDNLAGKGGFKYWVDDNGIIFAAATGSYDVSVLSMYPGTSAEGAIESLLSSQWSFKAEYLWYAVNGDNQCLYSTGVYEKDNHEIALTTKTDSNIDNVDIMEYIDVELAKKDAEEHGGQMTENTAFAYIHHIN